MRLRLLGRFFPALLIATCFNLAYAWEAKYSTDYIASGFASNREAHGVANEMIRQFNSEAVVKHLKNTKNDISSESSVPLELIASGLLEITTRPSMVNYPDGLRGIRVEIQAYVSDDALDKALDVIKAPSVPAKELSQLSRTYRSTLIEYTEATSGITKASNKKQYKAALKQLHSAQKKLDRIRIHAISTLNIK